MLKQGTDEEIIRKKIEKLQKEVKETNKTNVVRSQLASPHSMQILDFQKLQAFQRQMKVKMNLLASALGTDPQQDENN